MKILSFIIFMVCVLTIVGCLTTSSSSSRSSIPEPEFLAIPLRDDSSALSESTKFFYQYRFGTREDDWNMRPEWALANLYNGGIKVVEAWYVRSTTPSSHRKFTTTTLYGPFFVVGLADEESYMEHFRYHKLDTFDPVKVSNGFLHQLTHYVSK